MDLSRFEDEQALCGVAPPAVRMRQVGDELRRRLGVHARRREVRLDSRHGRAARRGAGVGLGRRRRDGGNADIAQTPDATEPWTDLVELVLFDLVAEVRARERPLRVLDDAVVHVGDVDRAVRPVADVHRPEQQIRAQDEL